MDNDNIVRILHLSDLHIPESNANIDIDFKSIANNLIKDIKTYKKNLGTFDVLVISGDLTDKGKTILFDKEIPDFIDSILSVTGISGENVIIVPGNHDAERPNGMVRDQILKVRENCQVSDNLDDLGFMCKRFDKITELISRYSKNEKDEKSYGVSDINIKGKLYRFIRLNSSIGTYDKLDYNKLFVMKLQLDEIANKIDENVKPDLTFLVMHHPIDWFCYEQRILLEEYISEELKFNVDIIMNGHIHNGQVGLKSDLDNNIITLVSGIGYEKTNEEHHKYPDKHRYAIYNIDVEHNCLHGILRTTNVKRSFIPDMTLYKKINNNGEFTIPLKLDYNLLLHRTRIVSTYDFVVNDNFLSAVDLVVEGLRKFKENVKNNIDHVTRQKKIDIQEKIKMVFFHICCTFRTIFFPETEINGSDIRIHFRHYFETENAHKAIMSLYGSEESSEPLRAVPWNAGKNLIAYSYKEKRTLIASQNEDKVYKYNDTKWDEFITLAVSYAGFSNGDSIPAMSFGVSFKFNDIEQEKLDTLKHNINALSYVGLEHVMQNIIDYANEKLKLRSCKFDELGEVYEKK